MKSLGLATLLVCGGALALEQPPVAQVNGERFAPIGGANAKDAGAGAAAAVEVEHPEFEAYPDPEDFKLASVVEQFSGTDEQIFSEWKVSHAKKHDDQDEFSYVGKWNIEEPYMIPGFKGDRGLVLKTPAAHHAISRTFEKPLVTEDKPLVVQYEVKFQEGLQCGGAYVKLLGPSEGEFSNATPYVVMFGPDKCGATDKVHLIIKRQTPAGEWVEHHLMMPPRTEPGKLSSLYTLVIDPKTQFYEIRINGMVNRAGSLLEEGQFVPPFSPAKEIDDENDVKPDDWVDDEEIPDPEAVKPEDWDESLPFYIEDPDAVKPSGWLDDEPDFISDPHSTKPAGWDDEEDGEWIAPEVPNPKCVVGCGKWTPPQIKNPDYKGIWEAPLIPNPEYKGEWAPRKVANPDYFEDAEPAKLDPIHGVGLELWTMQADILFDNFYIGQSVWEAELLGNATWAPKYYVESQELKHNAPKPTEPPKYSYWTHFTKDPKGFFEATFDDVKWQLLNDPMGTLRDQPIGLAIVGGVVIVGFTLFFGLFNALLFTFGNKQLAAAKPKPNTKAATLKDEVERHEAMEAAKVNAKVSGNEGLRKRV